MSEFALDYLLLVFVVALGVLQIAASTGKLWGLLLFPGWRLGTPLGLLLASAGFIWFFSTKPRNVPDTASGLDGVQQAILFPIGVLLAVLFSLLVGSLKRSRKSCTDTVEVNGLGSLSHATYVTAFKANLKKFVSRW